MIYSLRKNKSTRGFTLIELLVVIAIIGVLATVVLASLNSARRKSRDARRITDIKQIQLALELYYDGFGAQKYPGGTETCTAAPTAVAGEDYGLNALVVNGGYISSLPRDPSNPATCYRYRIPVNFKTTYHLATVLEDSGNIALNSDKDCTDLADGAAPDCLPAAPATGGWEGPADGIQGISSADCTSAAGAADFCYDLLP